jgi:hypothetical protein
MCGIVGALSFEGLPKDMEKVRQEAIIWLMTELLYVTHTRGKDATGINASFADGKFLGLKMGIPSPEFITRFGNSAEHYDGFMKVVRSKRAPLRSFIGHCRKSSIGDSDDNNNNHPIKVDNIIGIHNGTLTNHDLIFKKLKCGRDGEVDSEAIMRLVHVMSKKGTEPFTAEMINEVCLRLAGTYSCLVINGDNPNQVATFRDGRPMEFALIKPLNMVVVASEKDFLKETLVKFNIMAKVGATGVNYPCLLKDDIELKMMPDDSVAVFDLTQTVTPESKIEDLFEGSKVVRIDKKWKEPLKGTHNVYNQNKRVKQPANQQNTGTGTGNAAKAEVGVKAKSGSADEDEQEEAQNGTTDLDDSCKKGRLWNKSQTRFDYVSGVDATKKIGGVEINPDSNQNLVKLYGGDEDAEVIELDLSEDEVELVEDDVIDSNDGVQDADSLNLMETVTNCLPEVEPAKVDTLLGDPGKIEDCDFPTKDEEGEVISGNLIEHLQECTHRARKVADKVADTKVMEMAAEVANNLPIYESDADLLLELNISDETVLRVAPLHALANRIMKHMYRVAWASGYTARKTEERKTTIVDDKAKLSKAQKNIRTMKIMMKILGKALNASHLSNYSNKKKAIDAAVVAAFNKGNLISATDIDTLFSAGDFLENPELRQMKVTVLEKEERK